MTPAAPKCWQCKHLVSSDEGTCRAFPGGIPGEIWVGEASKNRLSLRRVEHIEPYPGDNGIQFEPADDPGVMVALYPPPELAADLAVDGGEQADELHITLAYLGRLSAVGDLRQVVDALRGAQLGARLAGQLGGIGMFPPSESSEGRAVAWVPVDVPGLAELRQVVVEALGAIGAQVASSHGWTPHLTLAYLAHGAQPPAPVEPVPVAFNEIWLVCGEQRQRFPLGAQAQEST